MPFCISILTSVRRIVKIAVRFLHTKTALCDRKDTQSRFAVNAARSIVCVETLHRRTVPQLHSCFNAARSIVCVETITSLSKTQQLFVSMPHAALCVSRPWQYSCSSLVLLVSMPHAALCVSRPQSRRRTRYQRVVSMPHAALCVSRHKPYLYLVDWRWFQCRTQHCVCRDLESTVMNWQRLSFQCRTQHCVCRDKIVAVLVFIAGAFQCRTQHCVCRDTVSRSPCPARAEKAFWKDALFCAVFGVCG